MTNKRGWIRSHFLEVLGVLFLVLVAFSAYSLVCDIIDAWGTGTGIPLDCPEMVEWQKARPLWIVEILWRA